MQLGEVTEPKIDQAGPLPAGEFTYVDISSVDNKAKRIVDPKRLPADSAPSRAKQRLRSGDVLVSMTRPNLNAVALVPPELDGAIGSTGFHVLRARDNVLPQWLYYGVQTREFVGAMSELVQGALYPAVRPKDIRAFDIALPELAEQRRIVAEIERQFSRLDEAVTNLKRVKANLKRYKVAVLKTAVEGRLVATEAELALRSGRGYEAARVLLSQTSPPPRPNRYASRSRDVIPGHAALSVGRTDGALPEGWAWAALVDIARMESGHTPSRNHPEWWTGDVPWIGIVDAREHHGGVINDTSQHTNAAGLENSAARLLPAGTVCISRTASVGYVVVMGRPMATSQDFVNWIPTGAVTSDWLRIVFLADREALVRFGKGSVHKTIYFPEWLAVHIAVPPLAEQERIAKEVDRQLSIASAAEAEADQQLERSARLREAVLARTFGRAPDTNIDRREVAVGAEAMTRARLPVLPPDRGTEADDSRLDLVEVLTNHPEGMEPEALFREAGYKGDQIDDFYRDLDAIRDEVAVATTEADARDWPAKTIVRVALRQR